jgi:hypothetical protein
VNQDVAESGDLLPLDIEAARSELHRQSLDRLADHLGIADDRVEGLLVRGERRL